MTREPMTRPRVSNFGREVIYVCPACRCEAVGYERETDTQFCTHCGWEERK